MLPKRGYFLTKPPGIQFYREATHLSMTQRTPSLYSSTKRHRDNIHPTAALPALQAPPVSSHRRSHHGHHPRAKYLWTHTRLYRCHLSNGVYASVHYCSESRPDPVPLPGQQLANSGHCERGWYGHPLCFWVGHCVWSLQ